MLTQTFFTKMIADVFREVASGQVVSAKAAMVKVALVRVDLVKVVSANQEALVNKADSVNRADSVNKVLVDQVDLVNRAALVKVDSVNSPMVNNHTANLDDKCYKMFLIRLFR